jgi:predicted house-cleaning NTP pyrophosphatase (Maf/HAM1 superfamily)
MQVQTTGLKPVSTKQQLSTCMQTSEVNVENKLHDEEVQLYLTSARPQRNACHQVQTKQQ